MLAEETEELLPVQEEYLLLVQAEGPLKKTFFLYKKVFFLYKLK